MAKNVTVSLSSSEQRAAIEAKRGIIRNEKGEIIRSAAWKKERAAFLMTKKTDMQQRIKNIDAELKSLSK